jgi:Na+/H+ antiporter NhaA
MEGVREPLRTGTLLGVHNTCGSRVRFFSHAFDVHWLEELEHAERDSSPEDAGTTRIRGEPIWEWAGRNLSAASERLLSPADRIERAIAPWTTYLVLPVVRQNVVIAEPGLRSAGTPDKIRTCLN